MSKKQSSSYLYLIKKAKAGETVALTGPNSLASAVAPVAPQKQVPADPSFAKALTKLALVPERQPTVDEFLQQKPYTKFGPRADVYKAFADCLPVSDGMEYRNLNCCFGPFTADGIEELAAQAMPDGYNGFTAERLAAIVATFGNTAHYWLAREGSPAIYVRPFGRSWIGARGIGPELADEVSFEGDKLMFRLWFD